MDAARILFQGPCSSSIDYNEGEAERRLVVCPAYLPYDSEGPTPSRALEEIVHYCGEKNIYLVIGYNSNSHHTMWGSTNCNERRAEFWNF
jgi:hypothetical protein